MKPYSCFFHRNGTYFLNKPRIYFLLTALKIGMNY